MTNNERRRTGRRPNLSETLPTTGAQKNCMTAYTNMIQPPYSAAAERLSPDTCMIRSGNTGMMIPKPMESISAVRKMKSSANLLTGVVILLLTDNLMSSGRPVTPIPIGKLFRRVPEPSTL